MDRKSILNKLELAYAPLTGYEFAMVKTDPFIEKAIERASLYVIGQRQIITFENVYPDDKDYALNFEIHQKGNPNVLKGKLPLIQNTVGSKNDDTIAVAFNFIDKQKIQKTPPFNNLHGFSLCKQEPDAREFLLWFSPEKLLQNWWKKQIDCEIEGDFRSFLEYKVHYVGKATKQSILKRLTGHSTFQDILSLESAITYKDLPTHEIVVLFFEFEDTLQIESFGENSKIEDMVSSLKGENFPNQETVFTDAEKALIRAMEPEYNKQLFKNYPVSKDGLYKEGYDYISYSLVDPITLKYDQGEVVGELSVFGGDSIIIENNKDFYLLKK